MCSKLAFEAGSLGSNPNGATFRISYGVTANTPGSEPGILGSNPNKITGFIWCLLTSGRSR
jgi:hypothetical protein